MKTKKSQYYPQKWAWKRFEKDSNGKDIEVIVQKFVDIVRSDVHNLIVSVDNRVNDAFPTARIIELRKKLT